MKLTDIFETAVTGVTSVASIGKIEYSAKPNEIKLYKRCPEGNAKCIAKIKRKRNKGWRLITTADWKDMKLEHFGNLSDAKTPINGMKTISNNLETMFKQWGISNDGIIPLSDIKKDE